MMARVSTLAFVAALGLAATGARCGDDRSAVSEGDVLLSDSTYRGIDYTVSSETYRKWLAADSALDRVNVDNPVRVDIRRVTDDDVDRVVKSLEAQPQAVVAIESADLDVRDFVLTTIALAQSWDAVNRPSVPVTGLSPTTLALMREQTTLQTRPSARFIDDDDSDSEGDSEVRRDDKDSDSEGRRGKGNGRGKGKGRGRD
jgi:hypothetical protein